MAQESFVICDNCGVKHKSTEPHIWLNVVPVLASRAAGLAMQTSLTDSAMEKSLLTADAGELCSLKCLGEWSFARHALKELDMEVEPE